MTSREPSFLNGSSPFLQATRTVIKAWTSLNLVRSLTTELAALEHLTTSAPYFLFGSSAFVQVTRAIVKV